MTRTLSICVDAQCTFGAIQMVYTLGQLIFNCVSKVISSDVIVTSIQLHPCLNCHTSICPATVEVLTTFFENGDCARDGTSGVSVDAADAGYCCRIHNHQ